MAFPWREKYKANNKGDSYYGERSFIDGYEVTIHSQLLDNNVNTEEINNESYNNKTEKLTSTKKVKSKQFASKSMDFPRLSSQLCQIGVEYDAIIIGSGYGGSVAACRSSRAGLNVCILERGKEWLPGNFPESFHEAAKSTQVTHKGKSNAIGSSNDLFEFIVSDDISVVQGCGLGGGSLINANVGLEMDQSIFQSKRWPTEFTNDLEKFTTIDHNHAKEMLRPEVYPDSYPQLDKMNEMKKAADSIMDIENLGDVFIKTPLYVNFKSTIRNHVGVPQPACNNCGNCCSGCNTGAKNTLNTNYLADAKAHGAEIFTEVEVTGVCRDENSTCWLVFYKKINNSKQFKNEEKFIRTDHVFFGAGAIGSTKLLLKSRQLKGLNISSQIGKHFSGNADFLGASYNGDSKNGPHGLNTGKDIRIEDNSPGPTITSAIDLRSIANDSILKGVLVEDGTSPGCLKVTLTATMALMSMFKGSSITKKKSKRFEKIFKKLTNKAVDNSIAFLGMGIDDGEGEISFDSKKDGVHIKWDNVGKQNCFTKIENVMEKMTNAMGGTFVSNPIWSDLLDKSLITAHPLGGCIMATNGCHGVVNHMGEVFVGDTAEVHPGLYVMDGSIIPSSIGVNPSLTITALAERCMRLIGKKLSWSMDYKLNSNQVFEKKIITPGLKFTEKMSGTLKSVLNNTETHCEFTLDIVSNDVEAMIEMSDSHVAALEGTVTCHALSDTPLSVSNGKFQLFQNNPDEVNSKLMVYEMDLMDQETEKYYFNGIKHIHKDSFNEIGLTDTTVLYVEISKINQIYQNKELLFKGTIEMHLTDFMKQLKSMQITNTKSKRLQLKWLGKFSTFFAKSLWDTYSGISANNTFNPDAPPRCKRSLDIGDVVPRLYKIVTKDKIELRLTRFKGGTKGPLLVTHGMGMSTNYYSIDTIPMNFVEYFVKSGYDIWLFDYRASTNLPWSAHLQHNLDDIAEYDWEVAVDRVLTETGQKDLQVLVHCVGSLTFFMALLLGKFNGKIRNIIASQVALNPMACFGNRLKSNLHAANLLKAFGVKEIDAYTDTKASCFGKSINCFTHAWTDALVDAKEECRSTTCHRSTFMYNLLYQHGNLNMATHDCLHEILGVATTSLFKHVAAMMRAGKIVNSKGKNIYLGKTKAKNAENFQALNIPITILIGEENSVFSQDGAERSIEFLKNLNPHQEYNSIVTKGYGHLDNFIGKHASLDVYPRICEELNRYQTEEHNNHAFLLFQKTFLNLRTLLCKNNVKRCKSNCILSKELDPEKKIVFEKDEEERDANRDASINDNIYKEMDLINVPLSDINEIQQHLEEILPNESIQRWSPEHSRHLFRQNERYSPPTGTKIEPVFIEQSYINEHSEKNEIFVLSDLHLGGDWSQNIMPRLHDFVITLSKMAKQCVHTIVLLGDIFEMWLTPMTMTPPSHEEFIEQWKNDNAIQLFARAIRKMADEDDVKIYYVRGNHDHEITSEMIQKMFGNNVKFIPGRLVYIITNGEHEYSVRFEHGHDYDLFNSYSILKENSPLQGKPFGYFVTRAAATNVSNYMSDTEEVLESVIGAFLRLLPKSSIGATAIEMLAKRYFQKKFCRNLLDRALREDISDEECILLDDGSWTKVEDILEFRFIQNAVEKYGASRVFSMLRASLGIFDDFIQEAEEDVVVFGHSHHWKNKKLTGKLGDVLYANAGTWIDISEHFSYVRIIPPKKMEDGFLEVNYKLTNEEK